MGPETDGLLGEVIGNDSGAEANSSISAALELQDLVLATATRLRHRQFLGFLMFFSGIS